MTVEAETNDSGNRSQYAGVRFKDRTPADARGSSRLGVVAGSKPSGTSRGAGRQRSAEGPLVAFALGEARRNPGDLLLRNQQQVVLLITAYGKNEKEDLTHEDKKRIIKTVEAYIQALRK